MKTIERIRLKLKLAAIFAGLSALNASAGTKPLLLFVGDSHLNGKVGEEIFKALSSDGSREVGMSSSCGSWARHWITGEKTHCGYVGRGFAKNDQANGLKRRTPLLKDLLKRHHPETVVVSLGTNFIGWSAATTTKFTNKMLAQIAAVKSKCIWIGPPKTIFDHKPGIDLSREQVNTLLKELVAKQCKYVDLTDITSYPKGVKGTDGKHYEADNEKFQEVRAAWLKRVVNAIVDPNG